MLSRFLRDSPAPCVAPVYRHCHGGKCLPTCRCTRWRIIVPPRRLTGTEMGKGGRHAVLVRSKAHQNAGCGGLRTNKCVVMAGLHVPWASSACRKRRDRGSICFSPLRAGPVVRCRTISCPRVSFGQTHLPNIPPRTLVERSPRPPVRCPRRLARGGSNALGTCGPGP